jgi:hypothetical protein
MSKGAGEARTVSNVEPWETQIPYLTKGFERAEGLYNQAGPNYFPGQTYVDFSPQTNTALNRAETRATAGSPLMGQANTEMLKQLRGDYLDPTSNPFITNLYNKLAGDVTSGVQSQFTSAGRLGSGANQEVLAGALGDLGTQLYGQNYLAERGNMNNALMAAPQMAETDYNDIMRLRSVGAEREGLQEAALADAMNRYQYQQALPYEKLRNYQAATGGSYGQTQTNVQPLQRNMAAGLLSGGLAGAEMASLMKSTNPWFAGGGALLGAFM